MAKAKTLATNTKFPFYHFIFNLKLNFCKWNQYGSKRFQFIFFFFHFFPPWHKWLLQWKYSWQNETMVHSFWKCVTYETRAIAIDEKTMVRKREREKNMGTISELKWMAAKKRESKKREEWTKRSEKRMEQISKQNLPFNIVVLFCLQFSLFVDLLAFGVISFQVALFEC